MASAGGKFSGGLKKPTLHDERDVKSFYRRALDINFPKSQKRTREKSENGIFSNFHLSLMLVSLLFLLGARLLWCRMQTANDLLQ